MARKKSRVILKVADGVGGMLELKDRRFGRDDWPIKFKISIEHARADRWGRYVAEGARERGWSTGGLGQIDRAENSGTTTIIGDGKAKIEVVWERRRNRAMRVRARPAADSGLSLTEVRKFFHVVNGRCNAGATKQLYARATLHYQGPAWRGELWLDDKNRLAPPTLQDETASDGPRVVHLDTLLDCIGEGDRTPECEQRARQVSLFLTVALTKAVQLPHVGRAWVWSSDMKTCESRFLGYLEPQNPISMPARGLISEVPLYDPANRPNDFEKNELQIRNDITDLWRSYCGLTAEKRNQLLQAAAKFQEGLMHWNDRPSLSFALFAVACETLKPSDAARDQNCYDVIEGLLGKAARDRVQQGPFPAQNVRNAHLHAGEFLGAEFEMMDFFATYKDPSFRDALRELISVTEEALIKWLELGGSFAMPVPKQRRPTPMRWFREHIVETIVVTFGLGLIVGGIVVAGYCR